MEEALEELRIKLTSPPLVPYPDFEKPFVLETDAYFASFGAVIAQKKEDGKIHPIRYTSHNINSAERMYTAFAGEALAVIFSLMKFRVYLVSSMPFTLITDHQAHCYAFRKREIHGRLACWLEFVAE